MLYCEECERLFEEEDMEHRDVWYDDIRPKRFCPCCPHCGELNISDCCKCSVCGEEFAPLGLNEERTDICHECYEGFINEKYCQKLGEKHPETVHINAFLEWYCGGEKGIEEILKRYVKDDLKENPCNFRDFIEEFAEWELAEIYAQEVSENA